MRILLTGASSFTGYWFSNALARAGHHVTATFRGTPLSYSEIRAQRVGSLKALVECIWELEFGSDRFIDLLNSGQWDLFCHHAAEMTDYRSLDFDPLAAARSNTRNLRTVLMQLAHRGCNRVILTGSVFEPYEGVGDSEQRAFSPYGLSKHFSFEMFRFEAMRLGMMVGKFIIPNPFGPLEEPRFTSYLAREWSVGRTPMVATPGYVRDNIHVSLLAAEYVGFCQQTDFGAGVRRIAPSGYIERQGAFAERCARELGQRLGRVLPLNLAKQTEFPEPPIRTNFTLSEARFPMWSEAGAWDELRDYYADRWGLAHAPPI